MYIDFQLVSLANIKLCCSIFDLVVESSYVAQKHPWVEGFSASDRLLVFKE